MLFGQKVLITGASGQLGQHLLKVLQRYSNSFKEVVCITRNSKFKSQHHVEVQDLCDSQELRATLDRIRPSIVIHLAGITSPSAADENRDAANLLHHHATREIAKYAKQNSAWVLLASTDYVYAGDTAGSYAESDPALPTTHYGKSKLAGEHEILKRNVGAVCRFSFLWGRSTCARDHGWNEVSCRLKDGEPVQGISDELRSPLRFDHAAKIILKLHARQWRGLVNIGGDVAMSPFELLIFARDKLQSSSEVVPVSRAQYSPRLERPANLVLDSTLLHSIIGGNKELERLNGRFDRYGSASAHHV